MKMLSTLSLAALLMSGAAFAATAPTGATPTATPATQAQPAQKHSAAHCEKQAKEKKLTGDAEKQFLKECKGKKAS